MKKLLLILTLLFTLNIFSQRVVIHTDKVSTGHWNTIEENWIWEPVKYTFINFVIQGNTVIVDDVAESTYKLFECTVDKPKFSMWTALDEQNIECNFIMNFTNPNTVSVMYSDVIYVYEIDYVE